MQGRKPNPRNVVPLRSEDSDHAVDLRRAAIRKIVNRLRPRRLDDELKAEWKRVATVLADPTVDRLKARYVDAILEYCRLCVRLRKLYDAFPDIEAETYEAATRNGVQRKTDPRVGQRNETWRQWNSLRMELGLGPASERNLLPGQGDLFDESEQHFA